MTPSVSQAESWRPDSLVELADTWQTAGDALQSTGAELARHDRSVWSGAAAAPGWAELDRHRVDAVALGRALQCAAAAARHGAVALGSSRDAVLDLVSQVRARGYLITEDGTVAENPGRGIDAAEAVLTGRLRGALHRLGGTDAAIAAEIRSAWQSADPRPAPDSEPPPTAPPSGPAEPALPAAADIVAAWPGMAQDLIAEQLRSMSERQRRQLIEAEPLAVGNTDGVPWEMRVAANRITIGAAIEEQQRLLDRPETDKVDDMLARGFTLTLPAALLGLPAPGGSGRAADERRRAAVLGNPTLRAAAVAAHDQDPRRHLEFYRGLLAPTSDPTGRSSATVERQILAFDPRRSSFIELHGDLRSATSLGVLVPGTNTTGVDSAANTRTARRFVAQGQGKVAMITYLGGPFPHGPHLTGLYRAADPSYAVQMAPRLVAFSEDVNRTVDATGRHIPVTYLGHSYGGSILGTAERLGLTADRTVYVAAAGAGVGVHGPEDWNNRNPNVERYSMTAPSDPINVVQGIPGGPHGGDVDEFPGVWRLPTGRRLDDSRMEGGAAHGDIVNEPSDAWQNLLAVITGTPIRPRAGMP